MTVLVTCQFDDDPIKAEGAIVSKTLFSSTQGDGDSKVNARMWLEFELVRECTPILVTSKLYCHPIKNEIIIMSTTSSPL